ncbi:MAG: sulfotransferase [Chromatiaceae bacterium]|nr:sulfotransferase [Chromatiaceae bacterium]MBP6733807.1 sulfotransferase [Chromatiaceae bacterium]MBP6806751.1 sulfotransferase [Chromatiaceae bacterium]MBP8283718.1 sulfotransferase [Chromatiaceae bacterium]MBP8288445.1 sulfotransferase [Chromatiaceae bacterium]
MLSFLGIGAQKAGTTWLYEILRQHPELGFPGGKESHYWTLRTAARDAGAVAAYLAHFQDPRRREGEITPAYAALDEAAIACLGAAAPRLRLIFMMRNPLERAWSAALMVLARLDMEYAEVSDAWFLTLLRSRASLDRGDYAATIRRWCRWFPREALLTPTYETLGTDPEGLVNACLRHIGVAELDPATLRRLGTRRVIFAGQHRPLPAPLWAELRGLYQDRIADLEQLLDLDLSHWLTPPPAGGSERVVAT